MFCVTQILVFLIKYTLQSNIYIDFVAVIYSKGNTKFQGNSLLKFISIAKIVKQTANIKNYYTNVRSNFVLISFATMLFTQDYTSFASSLEITDHQTYLILLVNFSTGGISESFCGLRQHLSSLVDALHRALSARTDSTLNTPYLNTHYLIYYFTQTQAVSNIRLH